MPTWSEYKEIAKSRGALAYELFVVVSTPVAAPEALAETLPDHLAYLKDKERSGELAFAGPLSDETGEQMNGEGMLFYRAESFEAALHLRVRPELSFVLRHNDLLYEVSSKKPRYLRAQPRRLRSALSLLSGRCSRSGNRGRPARRPLR